MANKAGKTEHSGAKRGTGAYWGPKADAKSQSNTLRRAVGRREVNMGQWKYGATSVGTRKHGSGISIRGRRQPSGSLEVSRTLYHPSGRELTLYRPAPGVSGRASYVVSGRPGTYPMKSWTPTRSSTGRILRSLWKAKKAW